MQTQHLKARCDDLIAYVQGEATSDQVFRVEHLYLNLPCGVES